MEEEQGKKFRRKFWIHPEIQARFVLFYVVASAAISVLMVCFIFGFVWSHLSEFISISSGVNPQEVFVDIFTRSLVAAGILFVIFAVAGSLLIIFITHRIAGPVYRIQKLLDSTVATEGAHLRSDDALQEVFAKIITLQSRNVRLSTRYDELVAAAGRLCDQLERPEQAGQSPAGLAKLREIVSQTAQAQGQPETS